MSVQTLTAVINRRCRPSAGRADGRSPHFLLRTGKPFYAGTYFPPQDVQGRPSFRRVLLTLAQAFREKNEQVLESAESVMAVIGQSESHEGKSGSLRPTIIDGMVAAAIKLFDAEHGGFGSAPKFPHPSAMDLLIQRCAESGDQQLLHIITTHWKRWRRVVSMTSLRAVSIATQWTSTGSSRTLKRWRMTIQSC